MNKAEELIYEVICDIENDFENKLTIDDIYQKLLKIQENTPLEILQEQSLEEENK